MAEYEKAIFGNIKIDRLGFNTTNNEILNELLNYTLFFDFDDNLNDYDFLSFSIEHNKDFKLISHSKIVIPEQFHQRPHNFANHVYGDPAYNLILLFFNGMDDWAEFKFGQEIKVPNKVALNEYLINLQYKRSLAK